MSPHRLRKGSLMPRQEFSSSSSSPAQPATKTIPSSSSSRLPTRPAALVPAGRSNTLTSALPIAMGKSNRTDDSANRSDPAQPSITDPAVRLPSRPRTTRVDAVAFAARGSSTSASGQDDLNDGPMDDHSPINATAATQTHPHRYISKGRRSSSIYSVASITSSSKGSQPNKTVNPTFSKRQSSLPPTSAPRPNPPCANAFGLSVPSTSAHMAQDMCLNPDDTHTGQVRTPELLSLPQPEFLDGLSPPTPLYALSNTPSTFCSDSTGPFSHSSTPTSMSSHSPGLAFSARFMHRSKDDTPSQNGPSPLLTQQTEDLAHQSYNSSSSNSTIKAGEGGGSSLQRCLTTQREHCGVQLLDRFGNVSPSRAQGSQSSTDSQNFDVDGMASCVQNPPELAHLTTATPQVLHDKMPNRPSRNGTATLDLKGSSPVIQSNMSRLPISHHRRTSSTESRASRLSLTTSPKSFRSQQKHEQLLPHNSSAVSLAEARPPSRARPSTSGSTRGQSTERERAKLRKVNATPPPQTSSSSVTTTKPSRLGFLTKGRKGPAAGTGHEGYGKYSLRRRSGSSNNTAYGSQIRSGSTDSISSSNIGRPSSRKSSMSSNHEDSSMDHFLRDRLSPVVIRGEGEASGAGAIARISNSSESQSDWKEHGKLGGWSSVASSVTSLASTVSAVQEIPKPGLLPSAMAREYAASPGSVDYGNTFDRKVSLELDNDVPISPSSAHPPTRVKKTKGSGKTQWPFLSERKVSQDQERPVENLAEQTVKSDTRSTVADVASNVKETGKDKDHRIKSLHKWNFFQRAQNKSVGTSTAMTLSKAHVPASIATPDQRPRTAEVPATVARLVHQPPRTVPHYAMIDMPHGVDPQDLEQIMREAGISQEDSSSGSLSASVAASEDHKRKDSVDRTTAEYKEESHNKRSTEKRQQHSESMLLPSPPSLSKPFETSTIGTVKVSGLGDSVAMAVTNDDVNRGNKDASASIASEPVISQSADEPSLLPAANATSSARRPNRLAQIGRIPKVVSKRDQERKLPSQSFSRPFLPSQPRPQIQPKDVAQDDTSHLTKGQSDDSKAATLKQDIDNNAIPAALFSQHHRDASLPQSHQFLSFSPRKNSDMSCTSSSGGYSLVGSMVSFPTAKDGVTEDEIWKEYDDLLDDVLSPISSNLRLKSAPPIQQPATQMVNQNFSASSSPLPPIPKKSARRSRRSRKNAAKKNSRGTNSSATTAATGGKLTVPGTSSTANGGGDSDTGSLSCAGSWCGADLPLKKENLRPGMLVPATKASPGTPISVTDLVATYEDRDASETEFEDEAESRCEDENQNRAKLSSGAGNATTQTGSRSTRPSSLTKGKALSTSPSSTRTAGGATATTGTTAETFNASEVGTSPTSVSLSTESAAATVTQTSKYPDPKHIEEVEKRSDGLISMANLRFGALMTSKWLTFGRVLFSPAQAELAGSSGDRVLVLDGLGTDWSHYCALTYPNVSVFNLGPRTHTLSSSTTSPTSRRSSISAAGLETLPNYKHIHHSSLSSPFPFPHGYFAAVVFRFPIATSESDYRAAVYECKRVLRPGGYLELSVLDTDMMNMGNRARRTVRDLKMRMQAADDTVSLKPVSDSLQRMLGRRGFEDLKSCVVGVPVAGKITDEGSSVSGGSREGSMDVSAGGTGAGVGMSGWRFGSSASGSAFGFRLSGVAAEGIGARGNAVDGSAENGENDERHMATMVARVGRWWYSRCYETGVMECASNDDKKSSNSKSIWSDKALLRECEHRSTSFRLLICYAQKPTITPRRTVSV